MENKNEWLSEMSVGSFQNNYILGDMIGRGSMSTVCSCLFKGKKKYACKIVPKAQLEEKEAQERIRILLKLRHENVVVVREVYDDTSYLYVIMDLATGGELLERLASKGEYSEREAARAIRDIVSALAYIHGLGLYHGNIRPEKLLYATEHDNSRLLITDMGVTSNSQNCYKMLYCAPEVVSNGMINVASDIWSLGVIMYIMLCGFEPFYCTQEMFPTPHWDDKTDEAKNLIVQLMQREPENRPTIQELLRNLWIRGEKIIEHSLTFAAKHLREFNARRKFKAATLAVTAMHRASTLFHYRDVLTRKF